MAVDSIEKPMGEWCKHASSKGCGIYDERPQDCRDFACLWLKGVLDEGDRPDKTRLVIVEVEKVGTGLPEMMRDPQTGHTYPVLIAREAHPGASGYEAAQRLITKIVNCNLAVAVAGPEGVRCVYFPRIPATTTNSDPRLPI